LGSAYLGGIIRDFYAEVSIGMPEAGRITSTYLYNPHLSYKNYMVPGIIVFLISIIGGALSALNIVSEKEKGTIEQINVSPVPKAVFLLSKLIPFWVIGFVLLTLGSLIAWLIYGLVPAGSFAVIYLFAAIYMIAFTGLGLAVSTVSSTQHQAMFTAFFFLIIFALMSGLFTPIDSMPGWAQKMTLFNPIRYFIEVMRMVYLKGSHFSDLTFHFLIVCLFALAFNILAIVGYRKRG
jgi:ABC-2 type transport system permease protein